MKDLYKTMVTEKEGGEGKIKGRSWHRKKGERWGARSSGVGEGGVRGDVNHSGTEGSNFCAFKNKSEEKEEAQKMGARKGTLRTHGWYSSWDGRQIPKAKSSREGGGGVGMWRHCGK